MGKNSQKKRGPLDFRDVMEIISGHSKENAKIPNRTDPKTGARIPNGMPMWRWRKDRQRNSPCRCGSGKKYMDCHETIDAKGNPEEK